MSNGTGGAIYVDSGFSGALFIEDTDFTTCSANTFGGAMYVGSTTAFLTMSSVIASNLTLKSTSTNFGGFVYSLSGVSMDDCLVTYVTISASFPRGVFLYTDSTSGFIATYSNFTYSTGGYLGGIYHDKGEILVEDCLFDHFAGGAAGAAIVGRSASKNFTMRRTEISNSVGSAAVVAVYPGSRIVTVEDCYFHDIVNTGNTAAMYLIGTSNTYYLRRTVFKDLQACNSPGFMSFGGMTAFIEDCEFTNLQCSCGESGVIYAQSNVQNYTFSNCSFTNNSAQVGSVYSALSSNKNAFVQVYNSSFSGNYATETGGVFHLPATLAIYDSTFTNNYVTTSSAYGTLAVLNGPLVMSNVNVSGSSVGSVVYSFVKTTIDIEDCNFYDNGCDSSGGVLELVAECNVSISNSVFARNAAKTGGGAVDAYNGRFSVTNSNFESNVVTGGSGGVFNLRGSQSYFSGESLTFASNEAVNDGGCLYVASGELLFTDSTFSSNSVDGSGGVMYCFADCDITLLSSSFSGSVSGAVGGVLAAFSGSSVTMRDSVANENSGVDGGVVFMIDSALVANSSTFQGNAALFTGGVFKLLSSSLEAESLQFLNNSAGNHGGSAYMTGSNFLGRLLNFSNNWAKNGAGGSLYIDGTATIMDSSFDGNMAYEGGSLFLDPSGSMEFDSIAFTDNTAEVDAGVILIQRSYSSSVVSFTECQFLRNYAYLGGVLVDYQSHEDIGYLVVSNSTFESNVGSYGGGSVVLLGGHANFSGCSFISNEAPYGSGGVILATARTDFLTSVEDCVFDSGYSQNGGCLEQNGGSLYLSDVVFSNCSAVQSGGCALLTELSSTEISSSTFSKCSADQQNGGGAVIQSTSTKVVDSNFTTGVSGHNGGLLFLAANSDGSNVALSGCILQDGGSKSGGCIYADSNVQLDISDTDIQSCDASSDGGGVYFAGSTFSMSEVDLSSSSSGGIGGGMFISESSVLSVADGMLKSNSAVLGGGLYSEGHVSLSDSSFSMNTAEDGGAIYASGTLTVSSSTFKVNSVSSSEGTCSDDDAASGLGNGGGIWFGGECSNFTITSSTFSNNTASLSGGGLYFDQYSACFQDSVNQNTFVDNSAAFGENLASQYSSIGFVDVSSSELHAGDDISFTIEMLDASGESFSGEHESVTLSVALGVSTTLFEVSGVSVAKPVNGKISFSFQTWWNSDIGDDESMSATVSVSVTSSPIVNTLTYSFEVTPCESGTVMRLTSSGFTCEEDFMIESTGVYVVLALELAIMLFFLLLSQYGHRVSLCGTFDKKSYLNIMFGFFLIWGSQVIMISTKNTGGCFALVILEEFGYFVALSTMVYVLSTMNALQSVSKLETFNWGDFAEMKVVSCLKFVSLFYYFLVLLFIFWGVADPYSAEYSHCSSDYEVYFRIVIFALKVIFVFPSLQVLYKLNNIWSPLNDVKAVSFVVFNSLLIFIFQILCQTLLGLSYRVYLFAEFGLSVYFVIVSIIVLFAPRTKIMMSKDKETLKRALGDKLAVKTVRFELDSHSKKYQTLMDQVKVLEKRLEQLTKPQMELK